MGWQGATALDHKNRTFLITLSHNWQHTTPQRRCLSWRDVPREVLGFESTHEAAEWLKSSFLPASACPRHGEFYT